MSYNAFEDDEIRRQYEQMLARQTWGHPERVGQLGGAILEARRRTSVHGGILSREEMIGVLKERTLESAKQEYKQLLMKLIARH